MNPKGIVYIGGGYVGLTGAVHYAKAGIDTTIFDINEEVVRNINNGTPKGDDFLRYLMADVGGLVEMNYLRATTDWADVKSSEVFIIAVPSERNGEPWDDLVIKKVMDCLDSRHDSYIQPIIIIESTMSPGATDKILAYAKELDLIAGKDFYLAVCPRKDWFADPQKNLATLPRVVGGVTDACSHKACEVISCVSQDIHITQYDTAELTKALENAFLHVPCMFAHEVALTRPDLDVAEALRLAGLHWRIPTYYLGFGSGGRCVPLGTKYLIDATRGHPRGLTIGEKAGFIDTLIRQTIADLAENEWTKHGGGVLVLGLGYRPDFKDTGLSPGLAIAEDLDARGVPTFVHDPLFTPEEVQEQFGLHMRELGLDTRTYKQMPWDQISVVLLATPHSEYLNFPMHHNMPNVKFILDSQGQWKPYRTEFEKFNIDYRVVGERNWIAKDKQF